MTYFHPFVVNNYFLLSIYHHFWQFLSHLRTVRGPFPSICDRLCHLWYCLCYLWSVICLAVCDPLEISKWPNNAFSSSIGKFWTVCAVCGLFLTVCGISIMPKWPYNAFLSSRRQFWTVCAVCSLFLAFCGPWKVPKWPNNAFRPLEVNYGPFVLFATRQNTLRAAVIEYLSFFLSLSQTTLTFCGFLFSSIERRERVSESYSL